MNEGRIVITCEHASAAVPPAFSAFFTGAEQILKTHRAYDPGAVETAVELARRLGSRPPINGGFTRLLIDLNRSLGHPRVFSDYSPPPSHPLRNVLIGEYKRYRAEVLKEMLETDENITHFSVHSFTPSLDGKPRHADIGLLYDPASPREKAICRTIRSRLLAAHPGYRVRLNYPYRGVSDGFTRTLRTRLGVRYAGIELELNHHTYFSDRKAWSVLSESLVSAASFALASGLGG